MSDETRARLLAMGEDARDTLEVFAWAVAYFLGDDAAVTS